MFHIIVNPIAGKKKALKNLRVVERIFNERGIGYELHQSQDVHDAEAIARRLTEEGATDLIVLGGDGTLHETLNGLKDPTACRVGLIPSGTGNDFAERAGIPLDVGKATLLILDGEAKETDYLEVGGVRCMNVAGFGMDVDVLERCQKGKMKGKPKYLWSLMHSLFAFKGCKATMESDGEKTEKNILLAAVCNGSQFGGGIKICPGAEIDDGKLEIITVDCIGGVFKIIGAFIRLMKGKILEYPLTTHILCEKVRFTPETPCTVQLDGELYRDLEFKAEIRKGLKFFR